MNKTPAAIWVVTDSPYCRLAHKWRSVFSQLPPLQWEIHWGYLSRPRDFWRRQNRIIHAPHFCFVQSLGWFASAFQAISQPRSLPLVMADLPHSPCSMTKLLVRHASAQIRFPTPPTEKGIMPLSPGFQLVCLADMVAGSGALEALWAFSMVRLAGWSCTLWMVGEGPLLEEYRQFAKLASVPEGIHFLPHFRSESGLPVNPDLVLIPKRSFPWHISDQFFTNHPKITSPSNGTKDHNSTVISWKPHLLCRTILQIMESLGSPKPQIPMPISRQSFPKMMEAMAAFVHSKSREQVR